jgi:ketosteroid isomerase-like protein
MSAEDIERIRDGFALFEQGKLDEAMEGFDPAFELDDHIVPEDTTEARGREALRAQLENLNQAFGEIHYELRDFIDLGDRILVRVGVHAKGGQTGIEMREEVGQIWRVRAGLATSLEIFRSWEEALSAAGISKPP